MEYGKLYGVGVGPGDKELLTLKAHRILKEADMIAVPVMKNGERTAYDIVSDYIKGKELLEFTMPMNKDFAELDKNYRAIADTLEVHLKNGKTIAFLTLGDVTIYSSYMRINAVISGHGFITELIPGVPSFCAAAARFNMPLCERDEPLIIIPASYEETDSLLDIYGTKVIMKAGRGSSRIARVIDDMKDRYDYAIAERCGMDDERLTRDIAELKSSPYLSLIIMKNKREK